MTNEQIGVYIKLLCYDWIDNGVFGNPDRLLMRLCNVQVDQDSLEEYEELKMAVLSRFMAHPSKDGFITNPRLQKEREKQDDFRKERSESGKKGAENRWGKPKTNTIAQPSIPNGSAMQEPMAKNGSSSSSSSSSSKNTTGELACWDKTKSLISRHGWEDKVNYALLKERHSALTDEELSNAVVGVMGWREGKKKTKEIATTQILNWFKKREEIAKRDPVAPEEYLDNLRKKCL